MPSFYLKNEKAIFSPFDSIYLPVAFVMFAAVAAVLILRAAVVGVGDVIFPPTAAGDFVAFVVLLMLVILLPPVLDVEFCANAF
jgi:hypothetical protein